jgi:hypothetical protein
MSDAYLDIETSFERRITVVGLYRKDRGLKQLVGNRITPEAITDFLDGTTCLLTYNGHRFDLPVIKDALGLDLRALFPCRDLMQDCWRRNLFGGFKAVEKKLGIARKTEGVDGMMAMRLWAKYVDADDGESLDLLLLYNREDVENLAALQKILDDLPAG